MTAQHRALKLWGIKVQLRKLAEECAECAVAALHFASEESVQNRKDLLEELADVEIMTEGMRLHFGSLDIDRQRSRKLARLEDRLNAAQKEADRLSKLTAPAVVPAEPSRAPSENPAPPATISHTRQPLMRKPSPITEKEGFVRTVEAAAFLGVTDGRIDQLVASGALRSERIGSRRFINLEDLQQRKQLMQAKHRREA